MKILLVDDEADVAQTCSRFLAETGHDCVTALGEKRVIAAVVPPQNSESVEIARICGASASFRLLYVMVILGHIRRKIVRFDVTQHPNLSGESPTCQTLWRSEVNSNCRYRFLNCQTTASCYRSRP
jgi:hypothetical protein